jgi:uncharacterized protein
MSFRVLARLIGAAMQQYDHVEFIWHGGEPTVIPLEFYKKAVALQARFLRPGCTVHNDLQTNATRLDDRWATFFKDWNFGLGVSLDGPREMQDRQRQYAGGRSSYDDAVCGIEVLKRHGIPVNVLMVVDEDTLEAGPDRTFDFMLTLGVSTFGCLAATPPVQPDAVPGTRAAHYVDPPRMNRFLSRMYDRWLEHGDPAIRIREVSTIHDRMKDRDSRGFCTMDGDCLGHYFIVEPNGDIAHCDLFQGDPRYSFGNITTTSFTDIVQSEALQRLKTANAQALRVMEQHCPEFQTCLGGCPHERYISYRHNLAHSEKCCGKYDLISHIRSRSQSPFPADSLRMAGLPARHSSADQKPLRIISLEPPPPLPLCRSQNL